jgi:hypothetical protein
MAQLRSQKSVGAPSCDGNRVLFEIGVGTDVLDCAISRMALEDISTGMCFKPADMLKCFLKSREQIETLALEKLRRRPEGVSGRLSLWSDDVDDPPTGSVPAAAQIGMAR